MSPKSVGDHLDHPDKNSHEHSDRPHAFDHGGPADALTPPTSEDNNLKLETESTTSDLSDLPAEDAPPKEEEDDEEEIVPDHYYDGGKIPVFKPVSSTLHHVAPLQLTLYHRP